MADSKLNELSLITTPTMNSPLYTVESSSDKRMLVKNISQVIGDENIAPAYDATETYSEGDYCMQEGKLYQCNTDISTAEAFDSTKWDEVKVTELSSGGGASVVQLTQAEYTALSTAEKMNGSIYKLTDKAIFYCLDEEYHAVKELTTAQYEALTTAQKNNGTIYIQTDAETTGEDIPVNTLTPNTSINSAINACFGRTGSDIPVSSSDSTSIADKLDNVPTFDTLTSSDNNKLLGVSVSGSDISVGAVDRKLSYTTVDTISLNRQMAFPCQIGRNGAQLIIYCSLPKTVGSLTVSINIIAIDVAVDGNYIQPETIPSSDVECVETDLGVSLRLNFASALTGVSNYNNYPAICKIDGSISFS